MTNPLIGAPLLRITYQQAKQIRMLAQNPPMLARYIKGVLISADDVRTLRAVAARNIIIKLECPGQRTYQGRVQQLLRRLVPIPATQFWFLPTTMTGPLRQSGSD